MNRPLTVLQILPELESGGVERGTLELGGYLAARGHRSLVISGGGRLVARLEAEGSRHHLLPLGRKSPLSLGYILPLRRFLLTEKVDILHLRSRMPAWIAWLAWQSLPPAQRPRLVTTFHGFYSINAYSAIMTKGERVIAVSQAIAAHIRQHYREAAARIVVIHRGVDTDAFDPRLISRQQREVLQRTWQLDQSLPVIMLPGRITRLKGHDLLLKALAGIKDLPWQAVFVGDPQENPGYAAELQRLAHDLELSPRIKFVGHCSEMPTALALADLVVSATSTHAEAFGRIAVEAAAMGKAMIASAHGGSLETVLPGETGWLFQPKDQAALAAALRDALADRELCENFGRAGRKMVGEKFTTAQTCAKTLALYQHLLNGQA